MKLSARQKDALIYGKTDGGNGGRPGGASHGWVEYWPIEEGTMKSLEKKGLIEKRNGLYCREYRLTELGKSQVSS